MYCVILGDIIDSGGFDEAVREQITHSAKSAFDRINVKYGDSMLANFGLVRRDSFEGILLTQYHAPQIIREIIKAFYRVEKTTVRISVVMGQLSVISHDRNEADGPAFKGALAALDKLKKRGSKHWLQVSFDINTLGQSLVSSQMALLTALTEKWTDKQREIVWITEEIESYDNFQKEAAKKQDVYRVVAKKLGILPVVVKKQLAATSYEAYRQAWDGLTEYLIEIDEYTITDKEIVHKSYIPYFNLGRYHMTRHDMFEAIRYFESSLESAKKELRKDDPQLIHIYNCLAEAYTHNEDYESAENVLGLSFDLQRSMPKTQVQYIHALRVRAVLLCEQNYYHSAIETAREALAVARDVLNPKNQLLGELHTVMGGAFRELRDYSSMLAHYEKSLNIHQKIAVHYPVDYGISLENIAHCYFDMQNYVKAYKNALQALRLYEDNLPSDHKYIRNVKLFLSDINISQAGEAR